MSFITEEVSIFELKSAWKNWDKSSNSGTIFQTYEWNYCWIQTFNNLESNLIYGVYEDNDLVAIVPLYYKFFFGIRLHRFIADNVSDYADVIIIKPSDSLSKYLNTFLDKNLRSLNQFFILMNISNKSFAFNLWNIHKPVFKTSQTIFANNSSNYVVENCNKKQIKNNERLIRRLEESGKLEFSMFNDSPENLSILIKNKKISLKKKKLDSILFNKNFEIFFKALLTDKNSGWFISTLSFNNEIIASSLNSVKGDRFYYYQPSFNGDYYKYSPSSLLLQFMLKELETMEHIKTIDFLKGDESYKNIWAINHTKEDLFLISNINNYLIKIADRYRSSKLISKIKNW